MGRQSGPDRPYRFRRPRRPAWSLFLAAIAGDYFEKSTFNMDDRHRDRDSRIWRTLQRAGQCANKRLRTRRITRVNNQGVCTKGQPIPHPRECLRFARHPSSWSARTDRSPGCNRSSRPDWPHGRRWPSGLDRIARRRRSPRSTGPEGTRRPKGYGRTFRINGQHGAVRQYWIDGHVGRALKMDIL